MGKKGKQREIFGPNDWIAQEVLELAGLDVIELIERGYIIARIDYGGLTMCQLAKALEIPL